MTEQGEITYYQHDLNHDHYYKWFEQLYGAQVAEWFDKSKSKDDNLERLLDLLEQAAPHQVVETGWFRFEKVLLIIRHC